MIPVVRGLLNKFAELRQFREQLVPTEIAWAHHTCYDGRRQLLQSLYKPTLQLLFAEPRLVVFGARVVTLLSSIPFRIARCHHKRADHASIPFCHGIKSSACY